MGIFKKEKPMSEGEMVLACAKLIAIILNKHAAEYGSNNITYSIEEITEKATGKSQGSIKIEWQKGEE